MRRLYCTIPPGKRQGAGKRIHTGRRRLRKAFVVSAPPPFPQIFAKHPCLSPEGFAIISHTTLYCATAFAPAGVYHNPFT